MVSTQGVRVSSSLGDEFVDSPVDAISNLCFSRFSDNLLVSSWDSNIRLYNEIGEIKGKFSHKGPVMDCCFKDDASGFSAGADKIVKRFDFATGSEDVIGGHEQAVRCVDYSHETGQVISGSFDRTLCCWDPRSSGPDCKPEQRALLPERLYSMSVNAQRVVAATAGRHVWIFDLRKMQNPEQRRESSLKYQTRCVRCYPNGTGYALSSVEGRVAMEFFDVSDAVQAKKYAFKCHRKSDSGRDMVFPVNAIAFHPTYGTFATGGCDGFINVWDGTNKKRLYQYSKYPTSIAALSFSRDGQRLAVASSYTYEMGDIPHEKDTIFVRSVNDIEVKPKAKVFVAE